MANFNDLLKGIGKLLFGGSKSTSWTYGDLNRKLAVWKENRIFPYLSNLPKSISFNKDFWDHIVQIYKKTQSDGLERSISIFWVDGELVVTSIVTGTESKVTSKGVVSVKYDRDSNPKYYIKRIYVDDKEYSHERLYYENIPKKTDLKYLFNLHTHPPREQGTRWYTEVQTEKLAGADPSAYSFFSATDIKSQVKTGSAISGLVTDRLWILIRSSETPNYVDYIEDKDMNVEFLVDKLHFAVYEGYFWESLHRRRGSMLDEEIE